MVSILTILLVLLVFLIQPSSGFSKDTRTITNDTLQAAAESCLAEENGTFYSSAVGCLKNWQLFPLHENLDPKITLYTIVLPICILLTLLTNGLIIYVMRQPKLCHRPCNMVLIRIATSDLLTGLFRAAWSFPYFYHGSHLYGKEIGIVQCYLHRWLMIALPQLTHHVSTWWIIFLAYQRHIALTHPRDCFNNPVMKKEGIRWFGIIVTVFAMLYSFIIGFESSYGVINGDLFINGEWMEMNVCITTPSVWAKLVGRFVNYTRMYLILRVIFFMLVPSLLIIILTISIIKRTRKIETERQKMFKFNASRMAEKNKNIIRITRLLVILMIFFLAVNGPYFILLALCLFFDMIGYRLEILENSSFVDTIILWVDFGVIASQWLHFLLYGILIEEFKETLQSLACRLWYKIPGQNEARTRAAIEVDTQDLEETAL